jgi:thiol-disulfide isomerase/thioredoxin
MSRRRLILAVVVVGIAAVVVVGAILARDTGPATPVSSSGAGSDALAIQGTDPVTGKDVSLTQFAGKPVVITIWASWCPGCNAEARTLARFVDAHPEAGFLGVDFQDTKRDARGFYTKYGWRFPSVFDPDGRIAGELGLQGTPTTIFLDDSHREVTRIVGETDSAGLAEGLEQATAGT